MSDLVKRLREEDKFYYRIAGEAADRVEALEAGLRDALDWIDNYVPADLRSKARNIQKLRTLAGQITDTTTNDEPHHTDEPTLR